MIATTLQVWTELLGLPAYDVVHCQAEADCHHYRLTVAPRHRVGVCPTCGKVTETVHQTRHRDRIRDLPISGYTVDLQVRVLQFQCAGCGACFTPVVPFLAEAAHATERFLEQAAQLVRRSDLANAAAFLSIPERTLGHWYYEYLQRRPQPGGQKLKPVRRMGIDELALKKNTGSTSQ
jgi:transposase